MNAFRPLAVLLLLSLLVSPGPAASPAQEGSQSAAAAVGPEEQQAGKGNGQAKPNGQPTIGQPPSFRTRGYYFTFMRMPTFDYDDWTSILDAVSQDGGNTVVLWIGGGFRSRKFPETWSYNSDHANIRDDFLTRLIDYAHHKQIRVLLGLTPFGYDGVNRMGAAHKDWQAQGPDGRPSAPFGIHSWGVNLCPAHEDAARFMLEYTREAYFDFYPTADGLFLESSDYAVCHCGRCGKQYFDHEFRFVRAISDEVWEKSPGAEIVVYPHYFSGGAVPGVGVQGVRRPFDRRWTVFFTPHSAPPDRELIAQAAGAWWWNDSPALHGAREIAAGARHAASLGCSGYLPSLESFSFVATEAEEGQAYLVGRRQVPFGYGWVPQGKSPYAELPLRINRIAYRSYSQNAQLSDDAFRSILQKELFPQATAEDGPIDGLIDDALLLQQVLLTRRTWRQAAPLADPERVRAMRAAGQLDNDLKALLRRQLSEVEAIAGRRKTSQSAGAELYLIADWLTRQWPAERRQLLDEGD